MLKSIRLFISLLILGLLSLSIPATAEPTFFLVDNSGSMTSLRVGELGVDTEVRDFVRNSTPGSEFFITYFRGLNKDDCESEVTLPDTPVLASRSFELSPESAGGSTLLVKAIRALKQLEPSQHGEVVMYTDGNFEDGACHTSAQVCQAVSGLKASHPNLMFRFEAPPLMRIRAAPVMRCAGLDGVASNPIEARRTLVEDINIHFEQSDAGGSNKIFWWPLLALGFLPIFLVVPGIIHIITVRRYTIAIQESDEVGNPNKKLEPRDYWRYGVVALLIAASVGTIFGYYVLEPLARDTHVHWFSSANQPLLAIVYAYTYTVVTGWYFVERMNDGHARKNKEWRIKEQRTIERFETSQVSDIQVRYAQSRQQQDIEDNATVKLAIDDFGEDESTVASLQNTQDLVRGILSFIDAKFGEITEYKEVRTLQNVSLSSPDRVLDTLVTAKKIDRAQQRELKTVLGRWARFVQKLPQYDGRLAAQILEFDTALIQSIVSSD